MVLPYIHSAREGVLRTGALLEQYGTYEPTAWLPRTPGKSGGWKPSAGTTGSPDGYRMTGWSSCPTSLAWTISISRTLTGAEGTPLLSGPAGVRGKVPPCPGYGRGFQSAAGLRFSFRRGPYLQYAPRLVYGPVFPAPHLQVEGDNADFTPESNDIPWSLCRNTR